MWHLVAITEEVLSRGTYPSSVVPKTPPWPLAGYEIYTARILFLLNILECVKSILRTILLNIVCYLAKEYEAQCGEWVENACGVCLQEPSVLDESLLRVCANTLLNGFKRLKNDAISKGKRAILDGCTTSRKLKKFKMN